MASTDVDLDALAPIPRRVKLGGKWHKLPGDMPFPLFMRIQGYEARVEKGEDEGGLLSELSEELLALFQVHQPTMKTLPDMGITVLLQALGAIYGGAVGEPPAPANRATRRQKTKTPSKAKPRRRATSA